MDSNQRRDDLNKEPEDYLIAAVGVLTKLADAMKVMSDVADVHGDESPQYAIAEIAYEAILDDMETFDEPTQELINQLLYVYHECWIYGYDPSFPVVVEV